MVGRLDRPGCPPALVSGQIDRLVVTPGEVLIVDYKTNHTPPASAAEAPSGYVRQLALYRAVLAQLYPGKRIRAALEAAHGQRAEAAVELPGSGGQPVDAAAQDDRVTRDDPLDRRLQRRRLLQYLTKKDINRYRSIIERLGIRR